MIILLKLKYIGERTMTISLILVILVMTAGLMEPYLYLEKVTQIIVLPPKVT
jgi:hypothetical protein